MKSPGKNTIKYAEKEDMLEYNQFKEYSGREIDELQETQKQMKARLTGAPEETLHLFPKRKGCRKPSQNQMVASPFLKRIWCRG